MVSVSAPVQPPAEPAAETVPGCPGSHGGSPAILARRSGVARKQVPVTGQASRCPVTGGALPARPPSLPAYGADTASEAADFLRQLQAEQGEQGPAPERLHEVQAQIRATGSYWQTLDELTWGAKLAWRNTPQCVGKFYWKGLTFRDMRHLTTADEVFAAIVDHLRLAFNGGRVKLIMTVFPPQQPGHDGIRIWNAQLVRYAGYRQPDGTVIGDPDNADFTDEVRRLGWGGGTGGRFDPLPVVIQMPGEQPRIYELPADAIAEVPISHPGFGWFADLGLRWHAFPTISDQRLEIGGVSYPAAPFSAWYTGAEIGARNFSDASRYDMLKAVAQQMGLDTRSDRTLWKDRAMIELVAAVTHSFDDAGVTMIDHHFAAKQFVRHELRERKAGRITPANYEVIAPPISGSATALWQRRYDPVVLRPNFFAQPAPWDSAPGCRSML
jgi:nitric-oxide synthase